MKNTFFTICKQFLAPLSLFVLVTSLFLIFTVPANAQGASGIIETIGESTKLPSFNNAHPLASYESGASNITSAIFYAVDFLKYIMGSIAVIFIIISGIRLIAGLNQIEEVANKQKEHLKYSVYGLILIIVADQFIKNVFFGEQGEIFSSKATLQDAAQTGSEYIKGIYSVIAAISAVLAVLMIVIAGFRLVTAVGNEEAQKKSKQQITYAIVGLVILGLAEFVIKDLIFPKQGSALPDVAKIKTLIKDLTNFISGFLTILAAIMYIYGGYLYVAAFGNEETTGKAKKVLIGATVGLFLALASYAIVFTTITLEPGGTRVPAGTVNMPANGIITP